MSVFFEHNGDLYILVLLYFGIVFFLMQTKNANDILHILHKALLISKGRIKKTYYVTKISGHLQKAEIVLLSVILQDSLQLMLQLKQQFIFLRVLKAFRRRVAKTRLLSRK